MTDLLKRLLYLLINAHKSKVNFEKKDTEIKRKNKKSVTKILSTQTSQLFSKVFINLYMLFNKE